MGRETEMEHRIHGCRSCGNPNLESVIDMGYLPLSDRFLHPEQLTELEPTWPLQVAFCPVCSLMQILETVSPEILFCEDYPYYSSVTSELLRHSRQSVMELIKARSLSRGSFVIELASNDGYLLRNYVERGIPVLGIDPAEGPARAAERSGVPTLNAFFTKELAQELRNEGKQADVIHANNVLAHVADTNGFVEGIHILLAETGAAVVEVPYVKDLIDHCEFDTIYHEHLCYFSLTALNHLFRRHGLFVNEVVRIGIHGGSLRLVIEKADRPGSSVKALLDLEKQERVDQFVYYQDFSAKIGQVKAGLLQLLSGLKKDGKRVAAYGAAAKGTILLNYVGIPKHLVEFVVDRNQHKQGCFMPGQHQPILPTERILEEMPDYVLILPWNFSDEIIRQENQYRERGGRFIIPIPRPSIL